MNTRAKDRIDYKVLHETGRKVLLVGSGNLNNKMDPSQDVLDELKVTEDIKHTLDIYDLDDLMTEEEIREASGIVSDLCQKYRHVHVNLKYKLGNGYEAQYPNYGNIVEQLKKFGRSAKIKLREKTQEVLVCEKTKEKEALKIEAEFLDQKIDRLNNVDIESVLGDNEIDNYIGRMEGLINESFDLSAKMKLCFILGFLQNNILIKKQFSPSERNYC